MLAWATFLILTFYGTLIMIVALPLNPNLKKKYLSENVTLSEWNFWDTSVDAEKNTRSSGESRALPHPGESRSIMSDSLQPHGPHSPWNSPGQNTGVVICSLLQEIFPTQGLNPGLPHCRQILY